MLQRILEIKKRKLAFIKTDCEKSESSGLCRCGLWIYRQTGNHEIYCCFCAHSSQHPCFSPLLCKLQLLCKLFTISSWSSWKQEALSTSTSQKQYECMTILRIFERFLCIHFLMYTKWKTKEHVTKYFSKWQRFL